MPPIRPTRPLLAQIPARFINDTKERVGKCITFGVSVPSHYNAICYVLRSLKNNWRDFAAGQHGYNTSPSRAGLHRHRIAWGDHDQMGHVNNVVYNFWAETARINWARNFALQIEDNAAQRAMWENLLTPKGIGLILKSIKTQYKMPLQYPDRVTVIHKLLEKPAHGMDALHLEAVVLSETHQRIAAMITEEIVVYDYRLRKRAPLPVFMVDTLLKEWEQQEKAAERAKDLMRTISGQFRKVEKETWDRKGAVEDMGAATGIDATKPNTTAAQVVEKAPRRVGLRKIWAQDKGANSSANESAETKDVDETPLEFRVSQPKDAHFQIHKQNETSTSQEDNVASQQDLLTGLAGVDATLASEHAQMPDANESPLGSQVSELKDAHEQLEEPSEHSETEEKGLTSTEEKLAKKPDPVAEMPVEFQVSKPEGMPS